MGGSLTKGGYDVLTTQYSPPVTYLSGYAQKTGTAFTGNVSVGGTLTIGGYDVLTTQYIPPTTYLSINICKTVWISFHGKCECEW